MFCRADLKNLEDYFVPCSKRNSDGVYFCRLAVFSDEIDKIIRRYIEYTTKSGICISQKIGNPDEKQLDYYTEIMGHEFKSDTAFFSSSLKKWLPRIGENQRKDIAFCFKEMFDGMAQKNKTADMQRNAYIKFMCWMYYKFEPILHQLGSNDLPKILFEGDLTEYELKMFTILSKSGCDILVLEYSGDTKYLQVDKNSQYSQNITIAGKEFPSDYSILELRRQLFQKRTEPLIQTIQTEKRIYTNTWIKGNPLEDVLLYQTQRGNDTNSHYNVFAGIYGAEEESSYYTELFKWKMKLEGLDKNIVMIEEGFPPPSYDEINQITRKNYNAAVFLINDMSAQIKAADKKIQDYCRSAFLECMSSYKDMAVQKLLNRAVTQVSWLNRYSKLLFSTKAANSANVKEPVLVYYGAVKNENEVLFLEMLSKLPSDVLIINPEAEDSCKMELKFFFLQRFEKRVKKEKFPTQVNTMQFDTVAFQAEQELNTMIYQDTGMYRNRQFQEAIPVTIHTTFEEIAILWNQEAKYRPNFETFADRVMVPVIFSKVSGIKDTVEEYWNYICALLNENTYLVKGLPYERNNSNPFKDKVYSYLSSGQLDRQKIMNSTSYPFAILKESVQDYILEKIQELIDSRLIEGTGSRGMENLILATVLNLDKKLVRLIQNYDFTKQIPKAVVIHPNDTNCTSEDAILLAFLNIIGFDVILFVPTGYSSIERFYTKEIYMDHQIGQYQYDLRIPDFDVLKRRRESFASKLFRRGK